MAIRIDSLKPGSKVTLRFMAEFQGKGHDWTDTVKFIRIEGEGDDRRAVFSDILGRGAYSEWEAYRYNGRWAYGSSAETLRLVSIDNDN
jgi:hypothetical protein